MKNNSHSPDDGGGRHRCSCSLGQRCGDACDDEFGLAPTFTNEGINERKEKLELAELLQNKLEPRLSKVVHRSVRSETSV